MIESDPPDASRPGFLYHMVKVYIDSENDLPIRFEAYDWPKSRPARPSWSRNTPTPTSSSTWG